MRYIDADKLREEWLENGENEYAYDTNAVLDSIDGQPTADVVEVKHGEWITVDDGVNIGDGTHMECSRCGAWNIRRDKTSYCPHCGAKMDGKGDSE